VRLALQEHPQTTHSQATMVRGESKLWIEADEAETRLVGLGLRDLAGQLQTNLEGGVGGSLLEDLEELPVRVRYADARRAELDDIASTSFVAPRAAGGWVPLEALASMSMRPTTGSITRYDGERCNVVQAYVRSGALPIDVAAEVGEALDAAGFKLPAGYRIGAAGAVEQDEEAKGNLVIYAPVLVTLMVSILILAFRSVRLALLLGTVAFLSIGLGLLATWLIQFPVSFNTILGTLGLIGVAFNDSIVVLAAIRANPAAREGEVSALVDEVAGVTRHIVSTTLTTMGGFLPLLLIVGGDFWPSLAIVLAAGVAGAMILALVFVPAAYVLLLGSRSTGAAGVLAPARS
jgi:multidrug efflux pump subunit AcrB